MIRTRRTRYFVFSKVNPTDKDFRLLINNCSAIKAHYYGYLTHYDGTSKRKTLLEGFFVLSKNPTYPTFLYSWFPNFLIRQMPACMMLEDINPSVVVVGSHPYISCRNDLFDSKQINEDTNNRSSVILFTYENDALFYEYPSDEDA